MVARHNIQPIRIGYPQIAQHQRALDRMHADSVLLLRRGLLYLGCQGVLHGRHADVHGQRRVDHAVALGFCNTELKRNQVAEHCAHQGVGGAVAYR